VEGERIFHVDLGKRLADARRSAGKTQEWLSDVLGLSRTSITNIECGRQPMTVYSLVIAASALNVDPSSLIPPPRSSNKLLSVDELKWVESVTRDEGQDGSQI
jgi:transcriptional regulator with XRE-family HTH domain